MRKALFGFIILILPSTTFSQRPDSVYQKWLLTPEIKKGFDFALSAAKLTYQDFTLRPDYVEIDSARNRHLNNFMINPLKIPSNVWDIAKAVQEAPMETICDGLLNQGDLFLMSSSLDGLIYDEKLFAEQSKKFPKEKDVRNSKSLGRALFILLEALRQFKISLNYSNNETDFIQNKLPFIVLENAAREELSVDQQDSAQKFEEGLQLEFMPMASPSRYFSVSRGEILQLLKYCKEAHDSLQGVTSKSDKPAIWEDKKRHAIIGGPGPNHYKGDYALIIDLGGDDTYELNRRPIFENQIIIDLGGNDKYFALEDYVLACGYFGYSVLIDASGDDLYQGKNFSLGTGFFGCGLLWDQGGSDTYIGDQFTQGAGGFGIGILKDDGGNDRYHAAHMAQGFGFVRGVGALLDAAGSDSYFAGGKYKELIGLSGEIRYQSMAQGVGLGLRPYLSGGMGFLIDYDGDDSYNVDMNGQGSSYWWGLGALVDFKGNDRYLAQQYAQGAGIHHSLGVLVDSSGNDFYFTKGASQGEGHDWGAGILFDLSGNDNYVAESGSQGFGNVNGFGMIVDAAGDDGYYVKDKTNTQAAGNPRREYGSIGLFLDCGGKDHYDGSGGNNRIWKPMPPNNTWGIGLDGEFGAADSAQVKK